MLVDQRELTRRSCMNGAPRLGMPPKYSTPTMPKVRRSTTPMLGATVLGSPVAVAAEAIAPQDRDRVLGRIRASAREVIELSQGEVTGFCGNMLELASWDENLGDCSVLVLSATAHANLSRENLLRLSAVCDSLLVVPVPTIERLGGGSIRCMLAEVFVD